MKEGWSFQSFLIPISLQESLKKLIKDLNVPVSKLIRRGIALVLSGKCKECEGRGNDNNGL